MMVITSRPAAEPVSSDSATEISATLFCALNCGHGADLGFLRFERDALLCLPVCG
jgi:hypothetical protein